MKDYRLSHQSTIKTERYERDVYRAGSYDDYVWQEEKIILDGELAFLKKRVSPVRYLDFGCGTGRIIAHLEHQVGQSLGVDIAGEMLAVAKEKVRYSRLIEADLTTHDVLRGQQFDIITAFRIFLNAEPSLRDAILNVLAPKLSSDGVFIFNIHGNTWSFRLPMVWWYRLRGRHLNHLSYRKAKQMLARQGLSIVRFYGFGIIPKPFYRFFPRASFALDRFFAYAPFITYISYNLIFVCKKI
jgi:predicted TPR repeat methyltransferase